MIWNSPLSMTLIDMVIAMVVVVSLTMLYRQRHELLQSGMFVGAGAIVAGLSAIGLFYTADLFVMWGLPQFITMPRAMAVMMDIHLNYSWVAMLAATVSIACGIGVLMPKLFAQADNLRKEIAERAQVMAQLQESEARFRSLSDMSSDFYWESDAEHRISRRGLGSKPNAMAVFQRATQVGERRWEVPYLSPDAAGWEAHRALLDARLPFRNFEISRLGVDGAARYISVSGDPVFDAAGVFKGYHGVGTNITERRVAEEDLRRFRMGMDTVSDGIYLVDRTSMRFVDVNAAACAMREQTREEILALGPERLLSMSRAELDRIYDSVIAGGVATNPVEILRQRKDGSQMVLELRRHAQQSGEGWTIVTVVRDITERKLAENKLRESEQQMRAIFDGALDGIIVVDADSKHFITANPTICGMLGYTPKEIAGMGVSDIHPEDGMPRVVEHFDRMLRGDLQLAIDMPVMRKDGSVFYADIKAAPIRFGGKDAVLGIFRDVSERIESEQKLVEAEAQYRGLVEQSIAGTYIVQDGKIAYVNPRYAEIFGYGSAEELIGRDALSIVAEKDRDTMTESIRRRMKGEIEAVKYNFAGLRKDGSIIDVGGHGRRATYLGRPAVIGMVQDISEKKRAEEQSQRYLEQLEIAFMSSVQVATTLGEMRDPYTAGHQRRVGEIAVAIGAELGFDAHRQEGLRVAGYLHDVGKITVPVEILSKPGKLNPIEFQLIQGHAQSSYDVLKDLKFPWPVAEVALQHHERIDGSGYPQGLKGEAILLEARIVAVADVVEAMSTHRPYRPGLGIDKTLAEIERGRATAYDPDVADACLKLFREKGYTIPE